MLTEKILANRAKQRRYYARHRDRIKARRYAYNAAHPEMRRLTHFKSCIKRNYGITYEAYLEMLARQGGHCAMCPSTGGRRRLAVDHDHRTGQVRGLLCGNCNTLLGLAKESPDVLLSAIKYLGAACS